MKISDWLDLKKQKVLMYLKSYCLTIWLTMKFPMKLFYLKRFIPVEFSAQVIIHFQLSSVLDTGIIPEVKTKKPEFTLLKWSGGCLQGIEILQSKQPNRIYKKVS